MTASVPTRTLQRAFETALVTSAVAWVVVVLLTPRLAESSSGDDIGLYAATFAYVIGSFVCHQRPERTFHVHGLPFPVCGRCCGIYAGAGLALLALATIPTLRRWLRARPFTWWRAAIVLSAVPTAGTFAVEWLTPLPVSNAARAGAGTIVGMIVASFVFASVDRATGASADRLDSRT